MSVDQRARKSLLVVNLGLVANILLAVLKTSVGIVANSPALLADGINSTSDVAYYVVVSVFVRLARKPADTEHPYGHTQLESIAAVVVGSFVVTTAIAIFWNSINKVYRLWVGQDSYGGAAAIALWIAVLTVVLKLGLTIYTEQVGRQTRNAAVLALAHDHRNDVFSALAVAMGVFLGQMGYVWVDPLAGALVALLILHTGIEILRESSAELMDAVPSRALAEQITELLHTIPEVKAVEEVHAHRFGPYLVVNVTIGVDGDIPVAEGDRIATEVEHILKQNIEFLRRVHVHYHPVQVTCDTDNRIPEFIVADTEQVLS